MLDGSSTNCPRWRYSVDCSEHISTLPSCADCRSDRNRIICNSCFDWDLLRLRYTPKMSYPKDALVDRDVHKIDCRVITYCNLMAPIEFAIPPRNDSELQKPRWLIKSNFLCLLNLPSIISKYGPIRNNLEGSISWATFEEIGLLSNLEGVNLAVPLEVVDLSNGDVKIELKLDHKYIVAIGIRSRYFEW